METLNKWISSYDFQLANWLDTGVPDAVSYSQWFFFPKQKMAFAIQTEPWERVTCDS